MPSCLSSSQTLRRTSWTLNLEKYLWKHENGLSFQESKTSVTVNGTVIGRRFYILLVSFDVTLTCSDISLVLCSVTDYERRINDL